MPCKVKLNVKRIHCPNCNEGLVRDRCGNVAAYTCSYCKGLWICADDFKNITLVKYSLENILTEISKLPATDQQGCPECHKHALQRYSFHENEFLFCTACKGLYFDNDELEKIKLMINGNVLQDEQQDTGLTLIFSCLFSDVKDV